MYFLIRASVVLGLYSHHGGVVGVVQYRHWFLGRRGIPLVEDFFLEHIDGFHPLLPLGSTLGLQLIDPLRSLEQEDSFIIHVFGVHLCDVECFVGREKGILLVAVGDLSASLHHFPESAWVEGYLRWKPRKKLLLFFSNIPSNF